MNLGAFMSVRSDTVTKEEFAKKEEEEEGEQDKDAEMEAPMEEEDDANMDEGDENQNDPKEIEKSSNVRKVRFNWAILSLAHNCHNSRKNFRTNTSLLGYG